MQGLAFLLNYGALDPLSLKSPEFHLTIRHQASFEDVQPSSLYPPLEIKVLGLTGLLEESSAINQRSADVPAVDWF